MNGTENACNGEENRNQIQQTQNEEMDSPKVSSYRIIASQLVAIFPIIFIKLRFGMGMGYTVVLIPELSKENAEIDISLDEITWFSSYCFVIPVAAIFGGLISQSLGVRLLLTISYLLHISGDLIFHWADSAAMILLAQIFVGITAGITKGPSFTYIAESLQPKYRSMAMAAMILLSAIGTFFATLLANFMYWRTHTLIFLVFSIIGFVFIHFIPESPQWLASKHRYEDAAKSLARLRGWTTPEAVKEELYSSIIKASDLVPPTESISENERHSRGTKLKRALSLYLNRSFYNPLLILTVILFLANFNGVNGISTFSGLIFKEIKSPISPQVGSTILTAVNMCSGFIHIFSVRYLGKRILTLTSIFIITVCFTVAVILLYLMHFNLVTSEIYSWIISVAIILTPFAYSIGLGTVIFILNSEIFPQKIRYVGAGIGYFILQILEAIFAKIFWYIVIAITFPSAFMVFIIINIVSFIIIYFILPETEGITLQQIEEHFAGKQNLKKKHSS